jgi:hypothetical protein
MSVEGRQRPWLRVGSCLIVAAVVAHNEHAPQAQRSCEVGWYLATYVDKNNHKATRCEQSIDYRWGSQGPRVRDEGKDDGYDTQLDADHFRVTWEGRFMFRTATYDFIAETDDGVRVMLDGEAIIDDLQARAVKRLVVTRPMTEGVHTIRVEYFEDTAEAVARFWWAQK